MPMGQWWASGPEHLRNGWTRVQTWWHPPDIEGPHENDALADAEAWASRFVPARDGDVYSAILGFAERSYDETIGLADNLDKKADDLMRIAGTIGAALAAAGRIAGAGMVLMNSRLLPASVACLVVTVLICARSRKPAKRTVPMTIRTALDVADTSRIPRVDDEGQPPRPELGNPRSRTMRPSLAQMKAGIAASYHYATVGVQIVNEWKAKQLSRATFFFCCGLLLLVAAFLRPRG